MFSNNLCNFEKNPNNTKKNQKCPKKIKINKNKNKQLKRSKNPSKLKNLKEFLKNPFFLIFKEPKKPENFNNKKKIQQTSKISKKNCISFSKIKKSTTKNKAKK